MARSIQNLREERRAIAKTMRSLVDNHTGAAWTEEINQQYEGGMAAVEVLDKEIGRIEAVLNLEAEGRTSLNQRAADTGLSADELLARGKQERAILVAWMRGGDKALTAEQRQAIQQRKQQFIQGIANLGVDIPSEGGFLAPDLVGDRLLIAMKQYGGMRQAGCEMLATSQGNTIPWPTTDPTSEMGEIIGDNAPVTEDDTIKFGSVTIGAHLYSSKAVAIPFSLLQDSMYDIEGHVVNRLGMRLGRIQNLHDTKGSGDAQPKGIINCAALGKTGANGQQVKCIWDDLVDLEHSVDPAYRQSGQCRYMFNDATLAVLKKMKDGYGRPIWLPGVESKDPNSIYTYPYVINQDIDVMGASAKSILFGRFDYYLIRDVMGFLLFRMTDSYFTLKGQVGFVAFSRHDGNLIAANNDAVKYYANSAT